MAFTFTFGEPDHPQPPEIVYEIRTATEFEVCEESRFKEGTHLILISRLNGEPLGTGSRWYIKNYRPDIDRVIVVPLGARRGAPEWCLTIQCVKDHFLLLDTEGRGQC